MLKFLLFGTGFGYILARVAATDYATIGNMFLLRDLHLMGVIGLAIVVGGAGMMWMRKRATSGPDGRPLPLHGKPRMAGNLWGGLLFGVGWAVTGTCPGTALAQLGEGKLTALATLAGILVGNFIYRRVGARLESALTRRPAGGGVGTAGWDAGHPATP